MRSVGPFLLTDEEFSGLRLLLEDDEPLSGTARLQPNPSLIAGFDLGTGESGETADVEAESATVENRSAIPETMPVLLRLEKYSNLRR